MAALTGTIVAVTMGIVVSAPAQAVIGGTKLSVSTGGAERAIVKIKGYSGHANTKVNENQTCTGTVIAPMYVLTAQHCTNQNELPGHPYAPARMQIEVLTGSGTHKAVIGVAGINRISSWKNSTGEDDLAVLHLKSAVDTAIKPLPLLQGALANGQELQSYGYGIDSPTATKSTDALKMARERAYGASQSAAIPWTCPGDWVNWPTAKRLWTSPIDGGFALGDSGGPEIQRLTDGTLAIAGVHQGGDDDKANCATVDQTDPTKKASSWVGFSNRVDSASSGFTWVKSIVPAVTTRGPVTPPVPPAPPAPPVPPANKPPVASFTWARLNGANDPVSLDGSGSYDPDGSISAWNWSSGGTFLGTGRTLTTTLGIGTNKSVTLTVTDKPGAASSITQTLSLPNRAPTILSIAPSGGVVPSTTPTLSAQASDVDGDALYYRFTVTGPSVNIDSGQVGGTWTVPAHRLDPGTTYDWTVVVTDPSGGQVSRSSSFTTAMLPTAADVVSTSTGHGYWQVASDGGVFAYGDAGFYGSVPGAGLRLTNILGMARTPDDGGYWVVGRDGGVFSFGDAGFYGSLPGLGIGVNNIVGMAATKTGHGYWLVGSDGGVFSFGDAGFYGSMGGKPLNKPVTAIAATPSGAGYWLAAQDGGIFAFGDAPFYGSMGGQSLNAPVVDMDATPDGGGYWMTAEDGGVFAFGDARFYGSMAGQPLNGHITGMSTTPTGAGYWLNACDGGIFAFGDAPFYGSNPTYQCRGT